MKSSIGIRAVALAWLISGGLATVSAATVIAPPILPIHPLPPPIFTGSNNCLPPPAGLVAWWKAEGSGYDSAGTNNALVPAGVSYVPAEVGLGFDLEGNTSRILVPDAPPLNFGASQDFSIEAWLQPLPNPGNYTDSSGEIMTVVGKRHAPDTLTALGYEMFLAGGRLSFQIDDNPNIYNNFNAGPDLRDGQFHHVVVTVQRNSTNGLAFYVDGQLIGTFDPTVAAGDLTNTDPLRIGNHPVPGLPAFYHGVIDEVSLYNRALGADEVAAIYAAGSAGKCFTPIPPVSTNCAPAPAGLAGWWRGEGDANDFTGVNNGVLQGGVGFAPGEVGQAFDFTAAGQAVVAPASPSLDVGTGPGFTVEAWINPTDVTAVRPIFEWNTGSGWGVHFHIAPGQPFNESPGPGELYANIVDKYGGWHQMSSPGGAVTSNVFQHVALTYDQASGQATIYCNGRIVSQQSLGGYTPLTSYDLYLGRRPSSAGEDYTFAGEIDEPAVYSRALSADEITAIYQAGSAGKCAEPIPPGIATQPADQTAVEGGGASFNVVPSGTGPFCFHWTFNGKLIAGATNASLSLTNLHPAQAGSYGVKITSPYGAINSAGAALTVSAQSLLVYKYAGAESIVTTGQEYSFSYSGFMFFLPDTTNGAYVGWATIKGRKTYWVNSISQSLLLTVPGNAGQSYTLFGDGGSGYDDNGQAHFDFNLLKGWNSTLAIGAKKTYVFPATFAGENTHASPDSQTGRMKLDAASSTFVFAPAITQAANNTGQTLADLINSQVADLKAQGYRLQ